jgi:hypothetical protein
VKNFSGNKKILRISVPFDNVFDDERHGPVEVHLILLLEVKEKFLFEFIVLQRFHYRLRQLSVLLEKLLLDNNKQRWSVFGWVSKNLLSRARKPLVPAAFAVASTHQSALGPRGGL